MANRSRRIRRWLAAMVILAALGGWLWHWWAGRLERSQDGPINEAAVRYRVEPSLIKAVVWQESRFNPAARGLHAEIGLMQLQEEAAREWADQEHVADFLHEHCFDPRTNTLAGTFYLAKLLRRYTHTDNPVPYALADYNAGRGNVLKWIGGDAATNSVAFINQIGFPGTRRYVQSVMRRELRYRP